MPFWSFVMMTQGFDDWLGVESVRPLVTLAADGIEVGSVDVEVNENETQWRCMT